MTFYFPQLGNIEKAFSLSILVYPLVIGKKYGNVNFQV